jgi:hypothetical protein
MLGNGLWEHFKSHRRKVAEAGEVERILASGGLFAPRRPRFAQEDAHFDIGWWITSADYSPSGTDGQFKFVKLNSSQQIVLCSTLGEFALGVLQNHPKLGVSGAIRLHGISKVVASAAISMYAIVCTANDGRAVTAGTTGQERVGVALTPAAAANDRITTYVEHLGKF